VLVGTKEKAKTKRAGMQTSETTRTANMKIENSNPTTKAVNKNWENSVLYKSVSKEGKTWGGEDGDKGGGEKHSVEANEENKAHQDSEILKGISEKEWTLWTIKTKKKQKTEDDFKNIKSCTKRTMRNSPAKKKGKCRCRVQSNWWENLLVIKVLWYQSKKPSANGTNLDQERVTFEARQDHGLHERRAKNSVGRWYKVLWGHVN